MLTLTAGLDLDLPDFFQLFRRETDGLVFDGIRYDHQGHRTERVLLAGFQLLGRKNFLNPRAADLLLLLVLLQLGLLLLRLLLVGRQLGKLLSKVAPPLRRFLLELGSDLPQLVFLFGRNLDPLAVLRAGEPPVGLQEDVVLHFRGAEEREERSQIPLVAILRFDLHGPCVVGLGLLPIALVFKGIRAGGEGLAVFGGESQASAASASALSRSPFAALAQARLM